MCIRDSLAIKLIPTLLEAYRRMSVNQIFLAVDAQVVLTWLLTEDVKTKNIFTRNRLIEIKEMIKNIKGKGYKTNHVI